MRTGALFGRSNTAAYCMVCHVSPAVTLRLDRPVGRYKGCVSAYPLDLVDEMFDLGVEMRRERVRRESPDLADQTVDAG